METSRLIYHDSTPGNHGTLGFSDEVYSLLPLRMADIIASSHYIVGALCSLTW